MARIDEVSAGGEGRSGWVVISDITVPGGVADNKVFQDPPNNTVLQSCRVSSLSFNLSVKAAFPLVLVNTTPYTLTRAVDEGHYEALIPLTLLSGGTIIVRVKTPEGTDGAEDSVAVTYEAPPELLTLSFTGGYPIGQIELKAGDTFQLTGTTDTSADAIEIQNFGAMVQSLETFVAGTSFTVTGTIADRGTVAQLLSARARARSSVTGAYGSIRDTNQGGGGIEPVDVVKLNNLYPSVSFGTPTYPGSQQALKGSETADVPLTTANATSIFIDSPNGQLDITDPTIIGSPKTVQRIAGSYNISVNNLRAVVTRSSNGAQTTTQRVVNIANVAAVVGISEPATRLRSGGNDGTVAQDHTITITADQQLLNSPGVDPAVNAGTFQGSWSGGPSVWTRALRVTDTNLKGTFSWSNLVATNLAGIVTTTITGDSQYTLGGFVARTVTWDAFQTISRSVNVVVADFSKLQAGTFSATGQPSTKWPIGTSPPKTDGYTISATGVSPHTVTWLDTTAAGSNTGEAYLFLYQEVV